MKKKILSLLLICIIFIGITGCGSQENNDSNNNNNNNSTQDETNNQTNKKNTLGDTIKFDGLELTFDKNYSFTTVDNSYSEHNGKSVIKLGVNVKNVSSEKNSLNMFYYNLFGSKGTQLDGVSTYFDDNIDFAGDLKPGASYKTYFYILYDGNGNYSIDFDNYSEEISVEFEIKK